LTEVYYKAQVTVLNKLRQGSSEQKA